MDLAHIAAEGLGVKLPDPTANSVEQWATFEAMITLLKPEAMGEFMAGMLPEMIGAMPQPFRGMMKWIEHTSPGVRDTMLAVMRPVAVADADPKRAAGDLSGGWSNIEGGAESLDMARVTGTTDFKELVAMEKVVPMPDYMKEQMPDLMPTVMENLLPKMLPEVIPHFLPRMEAYLKHEQLTKAA